MKRSQGFTVIELLVVITVLLVGSYVFFSQKIAVDAAARDSQRKIAINAMYYSLEEVYYEKNGFYPAAIDSKTLRSVDPNLFTDPSGYKMGDSGANYSYSSTNCSLDGKCKSYTLRSQMEKEAEFVKTSRRN
jgi:prepilin-type N-terminal cleavage/methylation domain-containing protein